jgi:uncharacterized protein (TIRG00374 family)
MGELVRAYLVGREKGLSASTALATIVVERILDVFFLVALLMAVLYLHPFPSWVVKSGYIMLVGASGLLFALVFLSVQKDRSLRFIRLLAGPLPVRLKTGLLEMVSQFSGGVVPLKGVGQYGLAFFYSIVIWGCYAATYYFCLKAFHLVETFNLPWYSGLVILIVTTISIVVPSSPGYVGTYHFLCKLSLMMFSVSPEAAVSYATTAHAVNFLPVAIIGGILAACKGVSLTYSPRGKNPETVNAGTPV